MADDESVLHEMLRDSLTSHGAFLHALDARICVAAKKHGIPACDGFTDGGAGSHDGGCVIGSVHSAAGVFAKTLADIVDGNQHAAAAAEGLGADVAALIDALREVGIGALTTAAPRAQPPRT